MRELALDSGFRFPYLYDETQSAAKDYKAACTPDFFLFDHELALFYRGRYDESRPGNELPVNGMDLKNAVDRLLRERPTAREPISEHGMQHQMEAGKRA